MSEMDRADKLSSTDFEYFVKEIFERAGWNDVRVTGLNSEFRHGDGGVDIFATRNGRRFAVEIKQRGEGIRVGVDALNQVHTGAQLYGVANRIVVTNRYFTSEARSRALRLGVDLIDRDDLHALIEGATDTIGKRLQPRTYQQAVIDDILKRAKEGQRRFLLEMATGLGKTITSAFVVRELEKTLPEGKKVRVLFLAHQLELLEQAARSYRSVFRVGAYSYSACFDGAIPADTDIVFGTFDTMLSRMESLAQSAFDVVVVDEAHHVAARTYGAVVRYFDPKFVLGLTATPYRTDAQDIFQFFGGADGHVGRYDLAWALKNRKLAFPEYRVFLDDLNADALRQLGGGFSRSDLDRHLFLRLRDEEIVSTIEAIITEKKVDAPRVIVFCRSIRHLQSFMQAFPAGSAVGIHSKLKAGVRGQSVEDFRAGKFRYGLVCDLFNEGVDIPEANVLVFLRQTNSRIVWLQQLGRGLRKVGNKERVQVLDFVGSIQRLRDIDGLRERAEASPREEGDDDRPGVHVDESIVVNYSESAAQVLQLVKNLELRLATRADAIGCLRGWVEGEDGALTPETFFSSVTSISHDQIRTHFESWWGFVVAAFAQEAPRALVRTRLQEYVATHMLRSGGVPPTASAVRVGTQVDLLPLVTEAQLKEHFTEALQVTTDGVVVHAPPARVDAGGTAEHAALLAEGSVCIARVEDFETMPSTLKERLLAVNPSRFWWVQQFAVFRARGGSASSNPNTDPRAAE